MLAGAAWGIWMVGPAMLSHGIQNPRKNHSSTSELSVANAHPFWVRTYSGSARPISPSFGADWTRTREQPGRIDWMMDRMSQATMTPTTEMHWKAMLLVVARSSNNLISQMKIPPASNA